LAGGVESSGIVAETRVPNDAQFGLIKSLYEHKHVLITGYASHMMALSLSYVSSGHSNVYLFFMLATTVIICLRYWDMCLFSNRFDGRATEDIDVIRSWETRYMVGSGSISLIVGLNAGYTFFITPYSTAAVVGLSMSFSSMISIVGRNFGSRRNVRLLSILNGFPCGFGMLGYGVLQGDWPLAGVGVLMFPVLFISDSLASFVREILLKSILSERRWQRASALFDAAVSNMPTGMIMVEHNTRTIVMMNDIAAVNLGLGDGPRLINRHVDELIDAVSDVAKFNEEERDAIKASVDDLIDGRIKSKVFERPDNKAIEFVTHKVTPSNDRRANRKTKFAGTVILCEDITERRLSEMTNWQQARYDYLSGLPNRQHIVELMQDAARQLRDDRIIAFCQFDVDGFKLINDTMGHEAGDEVIAKVAAKMRELQISDDRLLLARLGGDEFVLAYKNLLPHEDITALFNHAFSQICTAYIIKNKKINVRCSGGVACANRETFDLDDLMRKSDYVLYAVKHNPKRPVDMLWGHFSDNIEAEYLSKSELREALKEAISDGSINVAFQPVCRPDGTIEFCEALVRWNRSGHGVVDPTEMIKTAEELGMIQNITRQVLHMACAECASWDFGIGVSVNFTALDLHQSDCVDMIRDVLELTALDAHRLQIEVSEAVIMKNIARLTPVLNAISELGVKITIDDFGTGYALLNYMHKLPLSKVKIDRSFIQSISSDDKMRSPLNALIELSAGSEFDIIVEGVETDIQLDAVIKGQRVDLIQGYLLGHPMTGEKIREQLAIIAATKGGSLVRLENYLPKSDHQPRILPAGKI
jgi:diguanylate cyclase (GGDEF)-like protein